MKYHLVTLGCQMNMSDSERVRAVLDGLGYIWTDKEEEAGLVGILACSVRQKAIDKVYNRISKWNKWKDKRNLITFVSGCLLPADRDKFLKLFDLVFPMSELNQFPDMIRQYGVVTPFGLEQEHSSEKEVIKKAQAIPDFVSPKKIEFNTGKKMSELNIHIEDFWDVEPNYASNFEAFIPIQNGCDKFCTFCAVPYTRGREVSRSSEDILNELKRIVDQGFKSITLLGQNVNSYGLDKGDEEISFTELLEKIGEYGNQSGKEFWLYFTSPHPRDMGEEVIEVISKYNCLAKQIHLPAQSGDDNVLIRMNRKHSVDKYWQIIHAIHKHIPQATIFTDIIVGFTGETDEQFQNTLKLMEEVKFNMAYIAMYSPRPGAASSRWSNDIDQEIKKKRLHASSEVLRKHSLVYNKKLVGQSRKVLVKGQDRKEGYLSAYTEGRIVVRFKSTNTKQIGSFVDLKITSATSLSIEGELIETWKD
ncbi:MAG: MiaB/RimO family radical SAM methylthiotransferase [Bacteroidetes bacterium]|nr:MiaB/RimO family radical SAM methylthiotransferase [Bacteroidota bacterium]MBT5527583.1 MiaB/RimO family radical SAM methylthiotransferase [Cytophagia bacterium]MBT3422583.1 MiaB/RimO family radical SAM methylthiotransferase [Bacteroidota bacterium]MBT3802683.1 MiaB/RimO family radical SAM methylthiotransferase [Bacteroidota bacterium]MBT3934338.1 MiaB/RimO family radical SAM methylthiotransferase [Bacteroidota bacterium]